MINDTKGMSIDQLIESYKQGNRINLDNNHSDKLVNTDLRSQELSQVFIQINSSEHPQEVHEISSLHEMMKYLNGGYKINNVKHLGNGYAFVTLSEPGTGTVVVFLVFALIVFLVYAFFYYKAGKWIAKKLDED